MIFDENPTLKLFKFLYQINIIVNYRQKKHSFPVTMSMMGAAGTPMPKPKANWIPLAVVSLSLDYIELIPVVKSEIE